MEIKGTNDCNNSPKNTFVEAFTIQLIKQNEEFLTAYMAADAEVKIIGTEIVFSIASLSLLSKYLPEKIQQLAIDTAITHGKKGAVFGTMINQQTQVDFALNYLFVAVNKKIIQSASLFLSTNERK